MSAIDKLRKRMSDMTESVIRETQYLSDPFQPGPSHSQWIERMREDDATSRVAGIRLAKDI